MLVFTTVRVTVILSYIPGFCAFLHNVLPIGKNPVCGVLLFFFPQAYSLNKILLMQSENLAKILCCKF